MSVQGEQPHRVLPPQRKWERRTWPCGRHDGGFMFGDGDECRAADVILEDWVGPPLYTGRPSSRMTVDSTHTTTRVTGLTDDGRTFVVHNFENEKGLIR